MFSAAVVAAARGTAVRAVERFLVEGEGWLRVRSIDARRLRDSPTSKGTSRNAPAMGQSGWPTSVADARLGIEKRWQATPFTRWPVLSRDVSPGLADLLPSWRTGDEKRPTTETGRVSGSGDSKEHSHSRRREITLTPGGRAAGRTGPGGLFGLEAALH
jgi:hypothetical protein